MRINVNAANIKLTPEIYAYLNKKLAHVEKLVDGDAVLHVELGKTTRHHQSGSFYEAQIQLHTHGRDVTSRAEEESLYAAIDVMRDEITRELTQEKEKRLTLMRRGGRMVKATLRKLWPFG